MSKRIRAVFVDDKPRLSAIWVPTVLPVNSGVEIH